MRVAIASLAVIGTYLFQIPIATAVPGEPFLLFFAVVGGCSLAFGRATGFFTVALTSLLSLPFFEPGNSLYISNAADLIEVELYAFLSAGTVLIIADWAKLWSWLAKNARLQPILNGKNPFCSRSSRIAWRTILRSSQLSFDRNQSA